MERDRKMKYNITVPRSNAGTLTKPNLLGSKNHFQNFLSIFRFLWKLSLGYVGLSNQH